MENKYHDGNVTIGVQSLVMIIQAVDAEIKRLRTVPDENMVPEDYQFLEDYILVAEELAGAYSEASQTVLNLPDYSTLVK